MAFLTAQVHGHVAEIFFKQNYVLSHVINVTLQKAFSIWKRKFFQVAFQMLPKNDVVKIFRLDSITGA